MDILNRERMGTTTMILHCRVLPNPPTWKQNTRNKHSQNKNQHVNSQKSQWIIFHKGITYSSKVGMATMIRIRALYSMVLCSIEPRSFSGCIYRHSSGKGSGEKQWARQRESKGKGKSLWTLPEVTGILCGQAHIRRRVLYLKVLRTNN